MEKLAKNKAKFIGLSCLSISCLVGSFAYPLQKLEVYRQDEVGAFGNSYSKTFIITENELNYPYGFDESRAIKISHIYTDYKSQKILLLVLSILCAAYANGIGYETCINAEIDDEVIAIKAQGLKELSVKRIKHKLALTDKAQQLLFVDEMKALLEQFGSLEGEILKADELNIDKFINAGYLLEEGKLLDVVVTENWGYQPNTPEHTEMKKKYLEWAGGETTTMIEAQVLNEETQTELSEELRKVFPERLDNTYWNAIQKALANGNSKDEIIAQVIDVHTSRENRQLYYEFLLSKFS